MKYRPQATNAAPLMVIAVLGVALLLSGCTAGVKNNPKPMITTLLGAGLGAGLGAYAGSQFGGGQGNLIAIAVGTLAGALAGGAIGNSSNPADRAYMERSTQESLETTETGKTTTWNNPDSGNSGTITPKQTYQKVTGQYCREFEQTINMDGKEQMTTRRACRASDGVWKIIS